MVFDLRGHGESEGRDELNKHSLDDYTNDLQEVVSGLGARPVIIGHSMGGAVAQKYASQSEPAGIVLLGAVPSKGIKEDAIWIAKKHMMTYLISLITSDSYHMVKDPKIAREILFSRSIPMDKLSKYHSMLQAESKRAIAQFMNGYDLKALRFEVPSLVIGGEDDAVISKASTEACGSYCGSKPIFIKGMAHDMMLDPGWEDVAKEIELWSKANDL